MLIEIRTLIIGVSLVVWVIWERWLKAVQVIRLNLMIQERLSFNSDFLLLSLHPLFESLLLLYPTFLDIILFTVSPCILLIIQLFMIGRLKAIKSIDFCRCISGVLSFELWSKVQRQRLDIGLISVMLCILISMLILNIGVWCNGGNRSIASDVRYVHCWNIAALFHFNCWSLIVRNVHFSDWCPSLLCWVVLMDIKAKGLLISVLYLVIQQDMKTVFSLSDRLGFKRLLWGSICIGVSNGRWFWYIRRWLRMFSEVN